MLSIRTDTPDSSDSLDNLSSVNLKGLSFIPDLFILRYWLMSNNWLMVLVTVMMGHDDILDVLLQEIDLARLVSLAQTAETLKLTSACCLCHCIQFLGSFSFMS